ncbi:hypothetical protein F5146DRAFT_1118835 [Armillaria mellea]|nr:hypothetical protein F5146DRAFT_1118835 [Armillaria mellea]
MIDSRKGAYVTLMRDADGVAHYVDLGAFSLARRYIIDNEHRQPRVAVMESRRDNQAREKFEETMVVTPINFEGNGVGSKWGVFNKPNCEVVRCCPELSKQTLSQFTPDHHIVPNHKIIKVCLARKRSRLSHNCFLILSIGLYIPNLVDNQIRNSHQRSINFDDDDNLVNFFRMMGLQLKRVVLVMPRLNLKLELDLRILRRLGDGMVSTVWGHISYGRQDILSVADPKALRYIFHLSGYRFTKTRDIRLIIKALVGQEIGTVDVITNARGKFPVLLLMSQVLNGKLWRGRHL